MPPPSLLSTARGKRQVLPPAGDAKFNCTADLRYVVLTLCVSPFLGCSLQATPWTPEEDAALSKTVATLGEKDWCKIASALEGRTARQCRERFKNHLKEGIKKGPWSPEEDAAILQVFSHSHALCMSSPSSFCAMTRFARVDLICVHIFGVSFASCRPMNSWETSG